MKKCLGCNKLEGDVHFYKTGTRCKNCLSIDNKRNYSKKRGELKEFSCVLCDKKFKSTRKNNTKFCCKGCNTIWSTKIYRIHKKDKCEYCGFIPINKCQLDVDHIDGNHNNNELSNLQTLCANCHRLKSYLNKEGVHKNR